MASLEILFLPEATISNAGGVAFEWGSPFPENLVPSCCFSSATVWVSCRARPKWTCFFCGCQ